MIARTVGTALLAGLAFAPAEAQETAVDLELAFVVDASGSIDEEETRLQRQGYADALADPKVVRIVTGGFAGSIAVSYIEFAATGCVRMSVPWSQIRDAETARAFGEQILARDREYCPGGNAIGEAIAFATDSFDGNGFAGTRRVIDISGDGPNTIGRSVELARDNAVARGVVVNGLVIDRPSMPNLEDYFRASVTGGPRSFVIKAESRQTFARAILKKLLIEIADATPRSGTAEGLRILAN